MGGDIRVEVEAERVAAIALVVAEWLLGVPGMSEPGGAAWGGLG